jgi:hypothetical protein
MTSRKELKYDDHLYERNQEIVRSHNYLEDSKEVFDRIKKSLMQKNKTLSEPLLIEFDFDVLRRDFVEFNNNPFRNVARTFNAFGIGICPYKIISAGIGFGNVSRFGAFDRLTNQLIYINRCSPAEEVALIEFLPYVLVKESKLNKSFIAKICRLDSYKAFSNDKRNKNYLANLEYPKYSFKNKLLSLFVSRDVDIVEYFYKYCRFPDDTLNELKGDKELTDDQKVVISALIEVVDYFKY